MGEQSVSAIMPKFMGLVSGASLAKALPIHPLGRPAKSALSVTPRAVLPRNCRRESSRGRDLDFEVGIIFITNGRPAAFSALMGASAEWAETVEIRRRHRRGAIRRRGKTRAQRVACARQFGDMQLFIH